MTPDKTKWKACSEIMPKKENSDCEEKVWLASPTYLMGRIHYKDVAAKNGYAVGTLYWKETGLESPKDLPVEEQQYC